MMTPEFQTLRSFHMVGLEKNYRMHNRHEIPDLWHEFVKRLAELPQCQGMPAFGLCRCEANTEEPDPDFSYMAAVVLNPFQAEIPEGMKVFAVKQAEYAVFTHRGPVMEIAKTYGQIYGKWLPESGRELLMDYDFEFYGPEFNAMNPQAEDSVVKIFIPLKG